MKTKSLQYNRIRIPMNEYKMMGEISQGKYGSVQLIENKQNKRVYAAKIFRKNDMIIQNCIHRISWELKIVSNLNEFYFPKFVGTAQNQKYFYFLMEYFPGGDFYYWETKITDVSEKSRQFYMGQIVQMIEILHDKKIMYRDLKPENIILSIDGYLRLIDFGSAIALESKTAKTYSLTGTPEFMAPEMILKKGHTYSVDFWSLGIMIYEFITKENPFYESDPMESYTRIIKAQYKFPKNFPGFARDIIKKLLVNNPKKRLGALKGGIEDIKKHAFFSQTNWEDLKERKTKPPFIPRLDSIKDTRYFSKYKVTKGDSDSVEITTDPFILW